jgi:hypothetical protein
VHSAAFNDQPIDEAATGRLINRANDRLDSIP